MTAVRATLAGAVLTAPFAAWAGQDHQVALTPEQSKVTIRTYGIGILPLDGRFTRFQGMFRYDPDDRAQCSVALQIDAASLQMATQAIGEMVRGPGFLDVAQYPSLSYHGACNAATITGQLTMHGVTRPFLLTLDWDEDHLTATGRLQRADWGMTARLLLGGRTVRIRVTLPIPASQTHPAEHGP